METLKSLIEETDEQLLGILQADLESVRKQGIGNKDVYGKRMVARDSHVTMLTEPLSERSNEWNSLEHTAEKRLKGLKN